MTLWPGIPFCETHTPAQGRPVRVSGSAFHNSCFPIELQRAESAAPSTSLDCRYDYVNFAYS